MSAKFLVGFDIERMIPTDHFVACFTPDKMIHRFTSLCGRYIFDHAVVVYTGKKVGTEEVLNTMRAELPDSVFPPTKNEVERFLNKVPKLKVGDVVKVSSGEIEVTHLIPVPERPATRLP